MSKPKDITKKPNVEYKPPKSAIVDPKKTTPTYEWSEDNSRKNFLFQTMKGLLFLYSSLEELEKKANIYSLYVNDPEIETSIQSVTGNVTNSKNISYQTYLKALSSDGPDSKIISSIYEEKTIGPWGSADLRKINLLKSMILELEEIYDLVNASTSENPRLYQKLLEFINVGKVYALTTVTHTSDVERVAIDSQMKNSAGGRDEILSSQATVNEAIQKSSNSLRSAETSLNKNITSTRSSFYKNVVAKILHSPNESNIGSDGNVKTALSELSNQLTVEQEQVYNIIDSRAGTFSESAYDICQSIDEILALQEINKSATRSGGIAESDVSSIFYEENF